MHRFFFSWNSVFCLISAHFPILKLSTNEIFPSLLNAQIALLFASLVSYYKLSISKPLVYLARTSILYFGFMISCLWKSSPKKHKKNTLLLMLFSDITVRRYCKIFSCCTRLFKFTFCDKIACISSRALK